MAQQQSPLPQDPKVGGAVPPPPPLEFAQVERLRASGHQQGVLGSHIFKDAFGSTFSADT